MIRPYDQALDDLLYACGFQLIDPVICIPHLIPQLLYGLDGLGYPSCNPLRGMGAAGHHARHLVPREHWPRSLGSDRPCVRTQTALLIRWADKPAGAAFVAKYGIFAMVRALEILPVHQCRGLGFWAMRAAAH